MTVMHPPRKPTGLGVLKRVPPWLQPILATVTVMAFLTMDALLVLAFSNVFVLGGYLVFPIYSVTHWPLKYSLCASLLVSGAVIGLTPKWYRDDVWSRAGLFGFVVFVAVNISCFFGPIIFGWAVH